MKDGLQVGLGFLGVITDVVTEVVNLAWYLNEGGPHGAPFAAGEAAVRTWKAVQNVIEWMWCLRTVRETTIGFKELGHPWRH